MQKLLEFIKKHILLTRILCLLMSIYLLFAIFFLDYDLTSVLLFLIIYILYNCTISIITMININNTFDFILHQILIVIILSYISVFLSHLTNIVFKNIYISSYIGITSFFVLSYIYEIHFKNIRKNNNTIIAMALSETTQEFFVKSFYNISIACNIIRLILLILSVFESQYSFIGEYYKNLPITESIVTSIAFEKLIKNKK